MRIKWIIIMIIIYLFLNGFDVYVKKWKQKNWKYGRLWRGMQAAVWGALEAEPVHKSVRDLLRTVQMCAARNLRQPWNVRHLLHRHDHTWQQNQVPLVNFRFGCILIISIFLHFIPLLNYSLWRIFLNNFDFSLSFL